MEYLYTSDLGYCKHTLLWLRGTSDARLRLCPVPLLGLLSVALPCLLYAVLNRLLLLYCPHHLRKLELHVQALNIHYEACTFRCCSGCLENSSEHPPHLDDLQSSPLVSE